MDHRGAGPERRHSGGGSGGNGGGRHQHRRRGGSNRNEKRKETITEGDFDDMLAKYKGGSGAGGGSGSGVEKEGASAKSASKKREKEVVSREDLDSALEAFGKKKVEKKGEQEGAEPPAKSIE